MLTAGIAYWYDSTMLADLLGNVSKFHQVVQIDIELFIIIFNRSSISVGCLCKWIEIIWFLSSLLQNLVNRYGLRHQLNLFAGDLFWCRSWSALNVNFSIFYSLAQLDLLGIVDSHSVILNYTLLLRLKELEVWKGSCPDGRDLAKKLVVKCCFDSGRNAARFDGLMQPWCIFGWWSCRRRYGTLRSRFPFCTLEHKHAGNEKQKWWYAQLVLYFYNYYVYILIYIYVSVLIYLFY